MTDKVLSDLRRIAQTYPTRGTQDAVIAAVDEIQRLRQDLAAARAERDELLRDKQARSKIDATTRLHNLCDALAEQRRESPYDEESWRLADEDNQRLRSYLAAARSTNLKLRQYAKHYPECPMWGATGDEMCNCGLSGVMMETDKNSDPGISDPNSVICPNCCCQFHAVPVSVQEELARLRDEIEQARLLFNKEFNENNESRRRLKADLAAARALLPGVAYMDPPDGGAPTLIEQLQRMAKDAERYAWIRDNHEVRGRAMEIVYGMNGSDWDSSIDAALAGSASHERRPNAV